MPKTLLLLLLTLLAACGHTRPRAEIPQATDHVAAGAAALERGDLDRAEAELHLALAYEPGMPHALNDLGVIALARHDRVAARRWFEEAVRSNDDFAEAHANLGALALDEGDAEAALPHLVAALAIDPGYVPARHNLARALVALGRLDQALGQYLLLTSTARDDASGWAELAAVELTLGHRAAAARAAEEALVRDADARVARRVRGDLARDAGALDAAIADYGHALALAADDVDCLVGRGLAYLAAGRSADARHDLERAVDVAPRSARARFGLGVALVAAGEDAAAVTAFEQAAALVGEAGLAYPQADYLRAAALARLGRGRDALAAYRRFLRAAEGDATLAGAVADARTQIAALGDR
jgi:tetratricopeptide (TPR) repeat protein